MVVKNNKCLTIESILYAHVIFMTILVMYIILPLFNSLNIQDKTTELFNAYYNINFYKMIIITFFVNYIYLKLSDLIPGKLNKYCKRVIIILLISVLLNYYICICPHENGSIGFMKEWIKNIGFFSLIWDLFIVMCVGLLADKINDYNIDSKPLCSFFIFLFFTIFILHI